MNLLPTMICTNTTECRIPGFAKRLPDSEVKILLPEEPRLLVFKFSFIDSNFSYCPFVWHFCCKTNTEKLEKLLYIGLGFFLIVMILLIKYK